MSPDRKRLRLEVDIFQNITELKICIFICAVEICAHIFIFHLCLSFVRLFFIYMLTLLLLNCTPNSVLNFFVKSYIFRLFLI